MSRTFIRSDQLSQADLADAVSRGELQPWRIDRDGHRWLKVAKHDNAPPRPTGWRAFLSRFLKGAING